MADLLTKSRYTAHKEKVTLTFTTVQKSIHVVIVHFGKTPCMANLPIDGFRLERGRASN